MPQKKKNPDVPPDPVKAALMQDTATPGSRHCGKLSGYARA
jgi:hypothetical protein